MSGEDIASTHEKPGEEEDDDDIPVAKLIEKKIQNNTNSKTSKSSSSTEATARRDDSDSEDDLPIAELIKKRKAEGRLVKAPKKAATAKTKAATSSSATSSSSSSKPHKPSIKAANGIFTNSKEFYENTDKGKLIQTLLVRWWYAIEWPIPSEIGEPPEGYESVDGYLGVFVSTSVRDFETLKVCI